MKRFDRVHPIILAAGSSSRMGRLKQLIEVRGEPAICRVIHLCRMAGTAPPICVLGHEADAIESVLPDEPLCVVRNPDPARGQTSSLKRGLAALPNAAVAFLLFPVDRAYVQLDDLSRLLDRFAKDDGEHAVFVPSFEQRRGHPVVVREASVAEIQSLSDEEPVRAAIFRDESVVCYVEGVSRFVLSNIDTPEDEAHWRNA